MIHHSTLSLLTVVALLSSGPRSDGQTTITYELDPSEMITGCIGPALCECLGLPIGPIEGSFELGFSGLEGSFEVYEISGLDWVVNSGDPDEILVVGSGTYRIDPGADLNEIALDVLVDGEARFFATLDADGFPAPVPGGADFPETLSFAVFHEITALCLYDGFTVAATGDLPGPLFERGDCNGDGSFEIADPIRALAGLFASDPVTCTDACDTNDDGNFDLGDAVFLLSTLFIPGSPPPGPPFGYCGSDFTLDSLDCDEHPACAL